MCIHPEMRVRAHVCVCVSVLSLQALCLRVPECLPAPGVFVAHTSVLRRI